MSGEERQNLILIADEFREECLQAMQKHKPSVSLHEYYAVILEELEEFWDEVKGNHQERRRRARSELVQVAAMCMRSIHDLGLEK